MVEYSDVIWYMSHEVRKCCWHAAPVKCNYSPTGHINLVWI
jgi:hypothetical protein